MPIPYARQSISEGDVHAVVEVLRGEWLTQGPDVETFEESVAKACEAPYAVAFSSGTAALHASASAAGIEEGDELITSAITFAASANCGVYLGGVPRFADVDPATWNVSAETVAQSVSSKTKLVVPVHFAGLPAPIREIREAVGPDVAIVEDAAHALGAYVEDEIVGSCQHSDMTIFSFHPVKAVTAAEGGVVTTRDSAIRDRLVRFRNHGIVRDLDLLRDPDVGGWHYEQHELGMNYRLSDIHSALGRSQMTRLGEFIGRRNEIALRYRERLVEFDQLELPPAAPPDALHAYHLFVVRHRAGSKARRRLYDGLHHRGILAQVHYIPVYRHPFYRERFGYEEGFCPEAERYYEGCLSLPCFPALTDEQQDLVIDATAELS